MKESLLVIDSHANGLVLITGEEVRHSGRGSSSSASLIRPPVPQAYISLPIGRLALSFVQDGCRLSPSTATCCGTCGNSWSITAIWMHCSHAAVDLSASQGGCLCPGPHRRLSLRARIRPSTIHCSQTTRPGHPTELLLMHRFIHGTFYSVLLGAVRVERGFSALLHSPVLCMQLKVEHACVVVLHRVLRSERAVIVLHALIPLM